MDENRSDNYVPFPAIYSRRKLNALYQAIPLGDDVVKLLRQYFCAMANLYGIIPLRKAYEIINGQNPGLLTQREFESFAEIARHETDAYEILGADELFSDVKGTLPMDREIIQYSMFDDDSEIYLETAQSQTGKDYYIPERAVLLRYRNESYCEPTPQAKAMRSLLKEAAADRPQAARTVFSRILFQIRSIRGGIGNVFELLEQCNIELDDRQFDEFIAKYNELHNNTRMPCNRGFTPNELFAARKPEDRIPKSISFGPNIRKNIQDGTIDAEELRKQIMTMELPNEGLRFSLLRELTSCTPKEKPEKKKKIGRNEPCPCGSGKKYKHCCGR